MTMQFDKPSSFNIGTALTAERRVLLLVLVLLSSAPPLLGSSLEKYLWKNRLLVVFSPTQYDEPFVTFKRSVKEFGAEVEDRDLIVFNVFERGSSPRSESLAPGDVDKLRRRYVNGKGRFAVILIGKDGGVKMVKENQVELQEIFDLIDSMPMRRQEMRRQ